MNLTTITSFTVVGIAVRTSNQNGQAAADIGNLWKKFLNEDFVQQIPDKADETVYCIYTDYESDHTRPYTTVLGCKVNSCGALPVGFVSVLVSGGSYQKFTAVGKLMDGIVVDQWIQIWESNLDRQYLADFEVYGSKAHHATAAEVDIYIGLNSAISGE